MYAYHVPAELEGKKPILIQVIHRLRDPAKQNGIDIVGFPSPLPLQPGETLTNRQIYALLEEKIRPYILETLPIDQLVTLTKIKYAHASNGTEIPYSGEEIPVPIDSKDIISINWNQSSYFNRRATREIEQVGNPETEQVNRSITLNSCLDLFIQEERLEANNEWYCPRCRNFQLASKKFDIWFTPQYLIIHLKRFNVSRGYFSSRKNNSLVDFPIEGLDLSDYIRSEDFKSSVQPIYDLYAVSNHGGGLDGGHYTAYGKNFMDNRWYYFNDSSVSSCAAREAVSSGAYLLFYKRRDV